MSMKTLAEFRPGAEHVPAKSKAKKAEWRPPTVDDLGYGCLLAFDPSLSATGFVALERTLDCFRVMGAVTLRGDAPSILTGWTQTFRQSMDIRAKLRGLLRGYDPDVWEIVVESPPMGGGKILSPESAILVANDLHMLAEELGFTMLPMISPQQHKKATVGNGGITKTEHHERLKPVLLGLAPGNLALITNAAKRDGMSIAVTDLLRRAA